MVSYIKDVDDKLNTIRDRNETFHFNMVLPRSSYACSLAKMFFIDTGKMHCMPHEQAIHVSSINEKSLGPGLCIINQSVHVVGG